LHSSRLLGALSIFLVILLVVPALASSVSAWFVREDPLMPSLASVTVEPRLFKIALIDDRHNTASNAYKLPRGLFVW
jgi:hypothetical protein